MLVIGNVVSASPLASSALFRLSKQGEGFLWAIAELMGAQFLLSCTVINSIQHKQSLTIPLKANETTAALSHWSCICKAAGLCRGALLSQALHRTSAC